ncbi:hypothetical protein GCM10011363_24820 [Marivita lacus]|uniref:Uncharacterized protein n=2 Tax=Marivita lacus TaxID=1323742 RepID=A0ABQ1KQ17_9RHOB|nr:hypothetical protein GCM10011363_24820 [Marivita lacus]
MENPANAWAGSMTWLNTRLTGTSIAIRSGFSQPLTNRMNATVRTMAIETVVARRLSLAT